MKLCDVFTDPYTNFNGGLFNCRWCQGKAWVNDQIKRLRDMIIWSLPTLSNALLVKAATTIEYSSLR